MRQRNCVKRKELIVNSRRKMSMRNSGETRILNQFGIPDFASRNMNVEQRKDFSFGNDKLDVVKVSRLASKTDLMSARQRAKQRMIARLETL